jgi:hypothetical protein
LSIADCYFPFDPDRPKTEIQLWFQLFSFSAFQLFSVKSRNELQAVIAAVRAKDFPSRSNSQTSAIRILQRKRVGVCHPES